MWIDKSLLLYLFFPKGYQAIFFRAVFYLIPSVLVIWQNNWNATVMMNCVVVYLLIEGLLCPSRNILNDLKDYQGDMRRGRRWTRYVKANNWTTVFWANNIKIALTTIVSIWWVSSLWIPILGLIVIQILYDHVLKSRFAVLASFVVSCGYGFRVSSIFLGNQAWEWNMSTLSIVIITSIFAWYQSMEWRYYESCLINQEKLEPKPGTAFFSSSLAYTLVRIAKSAFVLGFLFFLQYMIIPDGWWQPFLLGVVVLILIEFIFPMKWLANSKRYFNSIFTAVFLAILIPEPIFRSIVLALVVPYFLCYHSNVYIPKETIHIFRNLRN